MTEQAGLIPAGYMRKRVAACPDWLGSAMVRDIFSVSSCISPDFADSDAAWLHNGFWLFDSPDVIAAAAACLSADLATTTLFYYAIDEREYNPTTQTWDAFAPTKGFATCVSLPAARTLHGFDVVSFPFGTGAHCSPLSCNAIAAEVDVNEHCLYRTLDDARAALAAGVFDTAEQGPFRIVAVHTVEPSDA